jgi:hypothetical protein
LASSLTAKAKLPLPRWSGKLPFYVLFNGMLAAYPMDIWSLRTRVFFHQLCNIKTLVKISKILENLVELE